MRAGALLIFMGVSSAAVAAGDDPICAQRPGKSTPTCTVEAGQFQVETGLADWSLQKGGGERDTSLVIGETTLRFGLTGRSEIQVDLTPWQRESSRAGGLRSSASGIGDVTVAYKQRLTADDAAVAVALLPLAKIPTAPHSLGNGKLEAALLVPIDAAIGKSAFSLNFTPEVDWAADSDGRGHHAAMVQVAAVGWQVNDRLNLSADLWGQWDWDPGGTTRQASADGAIAYLASKDVQLDAGANFGLNRVTPDIELYAGISERF